MEAKGKIVNTMPLVRRKTNKGFCKYQYISLVLWVERGKPATGKTSYFRTSKVDILVSHESISLIRSWWVSLLAITASYGKVANIMPKINPCHHLEGFSGREADTRGVSTINTCSLRCELPQYEGDDGA